MALREVEAWPLADPGEVAGAFIPSDSAAIVVMRSGEVRLYSNAGMTTLGTVGRPAIVAVPSFSSPDHTVLVDRSDGALFQVAQSGIRRSAVACHDLVDASHLAVAAGGVFGVLPDTGANTYIMKWTEITNSSCNYLTADTVRCHGGTPTAAPVNDSTIVVACPDATQPLRLYRRTVTGLHADIIDASVPAVPETGPRSRPMWLGMPMRRSVMKHAKVASLA